MRFANIFGHSVMVVPYSVPKLHNENGPIAGSTILSHHSFTTDNNDFYFFKSAKPSTAELFAVETKADLLTNYGVDLIARLEGKKIDWTYDTETKTRLITKEIDALDMVVEQDGDVVWCAIICTQEERVDGNGVLISEPIDATKDSILYTANISDWSTQNNVITLDRLTGLIKDETIIFKDFSFKLRDKSMFEGA